MFAINLNSCVSALTESQKSLKCTLLNAGIAQLVERNLAKVEVASSSLVSRSIICFNLVSKTKSKHRFKSFKCYKIKTVNAFAFTVLV